MIGILLLYLISPLNDRIEGTAIDYIVNGSAEVRFWGEQGNALTLIAQDNRLVVEKAYNDHIVIRCSPDPAFFARLERLSQDAAVERITPLDYKDSP
jgi:hypothetical protein